jgi:hypothetical protein
MTNPTALHPVDDFAKAVRAALADLPAEEVDDLTDGLEADLAERAADEESPEFGDPVAYANELRSAAGLPARPVPRHSSMSSVLGSAWDDLLGGLRELHTHPLVARLAAFFVALRPLWWAFRALMFYGILAWLFGMPFLAFNPVTLVLGGACLVVSVQLGRGKWQPRAWMRTALFVVNVVLVITVPVALLAMSSAFGGEVNNAYAEGANDAAHDQNGLVYNGRPISNIFAYDSNGAALKDVQLFDQKGRPLYTVDTPEERVSNVSPPYLVPFAGKHGRGGWNVYPLGFVTENQLGDTGGVKKGTKAKPSTPTFLIVPPLAGSTRTTSTPTPTGTPTPTATPTPAPSN